MRYELLLQPPEPQAPYDPAAVDGALEQRGATRRPDGVRVWRLPAGELEAAVLSEGGRPVATELRIPLSGNLDLPRAALLAAAELAEQVGLRVVDPQLARAVTARDEGAVADQYLRTAQYAGRYAGVSDAVLASFTPEAEGLKPGTKVLLAVLGLAALGWLLLDALS